MCCSVFLLSPHRLEAQLRYVREMGLNTIRQEGKLEPDDFYDATDRLGILVMPGWCCCDHWEHWKSWKPEDYKVAEASLRDQLYRLRNHACLLGWLTLAGLEVDELARHRHAQPAAQRAAAGVRARPAG